MKIQVSIKPGPGRDLIYPECETAKLLCQLIRQKSFSENDLVIVKRLGYEIEDVTKPPEPRRF